MLELDCLGLVLLAYPLTARDHCQPSHRLVIGASLMKLTDVSHRAASTVELGRVLVNRHLPCAHQSHLAQLLERRQVMVLLLRIGARLGAALCALPARSHTASMLSHGRPESDAQCRSRWQACEPRARARQ